MSRVIVPLERGYVEANVGYRMWGVSARDGVVDLISPFYRQEPDGIWPKLWPLRAQCLCVASTGRVCQGDCGIYAWKDPSLRPRYLFRDGMSLEGEVALWGRIAEHERGYRGEFAKVLTIYVSPPPPDLSPYYMRHRRLAELASIQYNVPLVVYGSLVFDEAPPE